MAFDRKTVKQIFADADISVPADVLQALFDEHANSKAIIEEKIKSELEAASKDNGKEQPKPNQEQGNAEYDKLKKELDELRAERLNDKKEKAFAKLLDDLNIDSKRRGSIQKLELANVEFENGEIKDADTLKDNLKAEYSDFIITTDAAAAEPATPPATNDTETDPLLEGFDE